MAHSRNDIIREGVEAEVAHNAAYVSIAGIGSWVMKDEDIVDLVMSHVDPLIAELADYKVKEAENAQGINAVPPDAPRPVHGPEDGPDEVEDGHLPGL